jgi:hypothetical protein
VIHVADHRGDWHAGEVLAYTDREGPGRPPPGAPAWTMAAIAAVLGVTMFGIMTTDTLCPEHRAWAQMLGGLAMIGAFTALVAIWRGWAGATVLTLLASVAGVAIGLIDAAHSATRGRSVALAFAVVGLIAAFVAWRTRRLAKWDEELHAASVFDEETAVAETSAGGPRASSTEVDTTA